ncbi:MAG TPA: CGGC domain-containing protein [Clostridia bacterium]|nr:CGGC domain-containing protein [Clostridia bacterium]
MTKIAILSCLHATDVCSGAACLKALRERRGAFERYAEEEDVELTAFFFCNGCNVEPKDEPKLMEKLERVIQIGTEAVHIGICTKRGDKSCPTIRQLCAVLEEHGIRIVDGTHPSGRRPKE